MGRRSDQKSILVCIGAITIMGTPLRSLILYSTDKMSEHASQLSQITITVMGAP